MPGATQETPFRDEFDRPDANPISGSWLVSSNGGVQIRDGGIEPAAPTDNGDVIVNPRRQQFQADQYAQVEFASLGTDAPGGLVLRDDGAGNSYGVYLSCKRSRGLEVYQLLGAPGAWKLFYRHCPPARAQRFRSGNVLRVEACTVEVGVLLRVFVDGQLEVEFVDPGRHRLAGQPGMTIDRSPTTARLGTFEAGNLPADFLAGLETFGRMTADGDGESLEGNGAAAASRFWCPVDRSITGLRVHTGNSLAHESGIRGLVYADDGGRPGALVAVTAPVALPRDGRRCWHDLPLPRPVVLDAGPYHLGIVTDCFAYTKCSGEGSGVGMSLTYWPASSYLRFDEPPSQWPANGRRSDRLELCIHAVFER